MEKQNNNKCQNFISIATMLSVIDNHKLITMGFHIHIGLLSLIQTCYWQSQVDCDGIPHPHRSTIIDTYVRVSFNISPVNPDTCRRMQTLDSSKKRTVFHLIQFQLGCWLANLSSRRLWWRRVRIGPWNGCLVRFIRSESELRISCINRLGCLKTIA